MEKVKIKKVSAENLKAISSFTALFNGKSAHVTGSNGIGKSTLIRALTDRLRGQKPSIITKIGEKEGKTVMELTDGCRFEWEYNALGKDKLSYFTPESVKPVKRDVFKHICGQYFPNQFDINKFLTTTEPRKRLQMISELVDIDLTEVQARYKQAFDMRADAKKELKVLESQIRPKPELQTFDESILEESKKRVDDISIELENQEDLIKSTRDELNAKYLENKKANDEAEEKYKAEYKVKLNEWLASEELREQEIIEFNNAQQNLIYLATEANEMFQNISARVIGTIFSDCFDFTLAKQKISEIKQPEEFKTFEPTEKPEFELKLPDPMPDKSELEVAELVLSEIKEKLSAAKADLEEKKAEFEEINSSKKVYELQLKQWSDFQAQLKKKHDYVMQCEKDVEEILQEIKEMISNTKLPDEFSIDLTSKNDILFRTNKEAEYLPITVETLASSAIFIAAFKLQANYLDAFRVAHFDVSYLDYENRQKVLNEAIKMDIQLITESPALEEGKKELQYVITEV